MCAGAPAEDGQKTISYNKISAVQNGIAQHIVRYTGGYILIGEGARRQGV
jgi:hypothetical protein